MTCLKWLPEHKQSTETDEAIHSYQLPLLIRSMHLLEIHLLLLPLPPNTAEPPPLGRHLRHPCVQQTLAWLRVPGLWRTLVNALAFLPIPREKKEQITNLSEQPLHLLDRLPRRLRVTEPCLSGGAEAEHAEDDCRHNISVRS
jgi:hypothetical protein